MGMAASQARLLTITSRMHDVEYQAQSIQNAKIQLATQSDEVYQEYLEALDATTLTIKDYDNNVITANFNNLCGVNKVDTKYNYALRDSGGRLIVSDDVFEAYQEYKKHGGEYAQDPYAFGVYMLDPQAAHPDKIEEDVEAIYQELINDPDEVKSGVVQSLKGTRDSMDKLLAKGGMDGYNGLSDEDKDEYDQLELKFNSKIYSAYADRIFARNIGENSVEDAEMYDEDKFKYYASIFKQIDFCGGCVSISDYDGINGDAANDSEFLKNMIECGKITVHMVETNPKNGKIEDLKGTSPSSDSFLSYTATTTIDKSALAKAEAEYQHETKLIDQKDKKFDMDLSKLETEREALKTELESVKKVVSENIERTFGIFS